MGSGGETAHPAGSGHSERPAGVEGLRSGGVPASVWSGWPGSNRRPPGPKPGALPLRYTPVAPMMIGAPQRSGKETPWRISCGDEPQGRSMENVFTKLARGALDLLLPLNCAVCHREGRVLCEGCEQALPALEDPYCTVCADPGPLRLCRSCAYSPLEVDGIRAPYLYEGPVRELIHALKYGNVRAAAPELGWLLALYMESLDLRPDVPGPRAATPAARARARLQPVGAPGEGAQRARVCSSATGAASADSKLPTSGRHEGSRGAETKHRGHLRKPIAAQRSHRCLDRRRRDDGQHDVGLRRSVEGCRRRLSVGRGAGQTATSYERTSARACRPVIREGEG